MSPEAVIGILIAMIIGFVGILYAALRAEDKRLARNIHGLRNKLQSIVMALAARGIKIPGKDEE